jgi:hypothetical protein
VSKKVSIANRHLNILIEVNVSGEQTKNGIPSAEALSLIKQTAPLPNDHPRMDDYGTLFRQSGKLPVLF